MYFWTKPLFIYTYIFKQSDQRVGEEKKIKHSYTKVLSSSFILSFLPPKIIFTFKGYLSSRDLSICHFNISTIWFIYFSEIFPNSVCVLEFLISAQHFSSSDFIKNRGSRQGASGLRFSSAVRVTGLLLDYSPGIKEKKGIGSCKQKIRPSMSSKIIIGTIIFYCIQLSCIECFSVLCAVRRAL